MCEGRKGESIDEVFINALLKALKPGWIRKQGNIVRLVPCGGRTVVVERMPAELQNCMDAGSDTTLMVWADCDHDCADGESLKVHFWKEVKEKGITQEQFERVVFIFAKDRIENWIEFLQTGNTGESKEGPRMKNQNRKVADAAKRLADFCKAGKPVDGMPPSLQWSCGNWRALVERMK
jgi:hypothetical protein